MDRRTEVQRSVRQYYKAVWDMYGIVWRTDGSLIEREGA